MCFFKEWSEKNIFSRGYMFFDEMRTEKNILDIGSDIVEFMLFMY